MIGAGYRGIDGMLGVTGRTATRLRHMLRGPDLSTLTTRARSACDAWMSLTDGADDWRVVDRASGLLMLRGHAPGLFGDLRLAPELATASDRLGGIPVGLDTLDLDRMMTRVDAIYFRSMLGVDGPTPDAEGFTDALRALTGRGVDAAVWTMAEMLRSSGVPIDSEGIQRAAPETAQERRIDLYFLAHVVLIKTRFLTDPLPSDHAQLIDEAQTATRWAIQESLTDLVAELALCLQVGGRSTHSDHWHAVGHVMDVQAPDGSVTEVPRTLPSMANDDRSVSHTTEVAMLALGGAMERSMA